MQSSKLDASQLLHLPEALQRNIVRFTEDLSFNQTDIPDQLISTGCLSEDDCTTIASRPSPKDQTRLLVRKIKARDPQVIEKFLEIVGQDHPHLRKEVNNTLEEIVKEHKHKPVCIICIMQLTVDLRDIGDYLWQNKIISDDTYDNIYEPENFQRTRSFIWSNIINCINNYDTPNDAIEILMNALKSKYSHISEYLRYLDRPLLSCSCCKRRRVRTKRQMSDYESLTDESTTSERTLSFYSSQSSYSRSLTQFSSGLLSFSDSIGKKFSNENSAVQIPSCYITTRQLLDLKKYCRPIGEKRPQLMHSISTPSDATLCDILYIDPDIHVVKDPTGETENKLSSETADIQDIQLHQNQFNSLPQALQDSKADTISEESAKETDKLFQHKNIRIDEDKHVSFSDTND